MAAQGNSGRLTQERDATIAAAREARHMSIRGIDRASMLCVDAQRQVAEARRTIARRLVLETEIADAGAMPWAVMERYVTHDACIVGRDPTIEAAKTALVSRYEISRSEAFAILKRVSQHQNRKVRVIAQEVVLEEDAMVSGSDPLRR